MKKIFAILLFVFVAGALFAQDITINGTVKDSKGEPVVGAVVMLQNQSSIGTVTNADGTYSIKVPSGKNMKLVVSCIGFSDNVAEIGSNSVINFTLMDDNQLLDEVVVVGYGAMRRSDLTGSVASIKIDEDNASKSATLDQMLEGKAAGVQVLSNSGTPDSGVTIRVRGIASFSGNTDPLYVVDGIIINGESTSVATMTVGSVNNQLEQSNGLAGINPSDIASIEILKDASATAIYGSQGANGVVLITTKQANREVPVISFNAGVSVATPSKKLDVLSFDEYVDMLVANKNNTTALSLLKGIYSDPENLTGLKVTPMDWQDYIFRTAVSQRYYLSVAGKSKGYNYMFSIGYNHEEGIVKKTDTDNITARLNLNKDIFQNLKLSFKTSFGYTKSNLVTASVNGGNVSQRSTIIRSALRTKPYMAQDYNEDDEIATGSDDNNLYGPSRMMTGATNFSERFRVTPSLSLDWKIIDWLSFKTTLGGDFQINERVKTRSAGISVGRGNMAGVGESQAYKFNWDNLLLFNKKWGKHGLNGTIGYTVSRSHTSAQSVTGWNLPQRFAVEKDINNAESSYTQYDVFTESEYSLMSFFARAIYNYNERYVFTGTLRYDGASKFKDDNKWGVFPSCAFAWRIVNEPWFNVPVISNAKLRLGWGRVGSQTISSYQTASTFSSTSLGNHFNDSGIQIGLYPSNIANPGLMWETSEQFNAGLDLSLWKGRLALTIDAYQKDTKDLLQSKNIAPSSGFSTMAFNDGGIRNRGVEFSIDAVPVKTNQIEWSLGGNISFNDNIVTSVGEGGSTKEIFLSKNDKKPTKVECFFGNALMSSADTNPLNIFISGQPMGLFYGYVWDGVNQKGETSPGFSEGATFGEGRSRFLDLNGNGYIDPDDRTIIGNPHPLFTYGFNTSLSWRRFSLKVDFNGSYGFDLFNLNNFHEYTPNFKYNKRRITVSEAWTAEKGGSFPALGTTDDNKLCSRYVEDGSYLRLSNVSLSYEVPIKKDAKILRGLTFVGSVGNLAVWSKYSGYSSVGNSYGSNVKRLGVESNSTPLPLSFNFDVKFRF